MERLTARQAIKHADGTSHIVTYCHGHRYGPAAFPDKYGTSNPQEYENYCEMVDRLAIYEDIGTVEDFQRLVAAQSEGRLVELPCKVGDNIYWINDEGNCVSVHKNGIKGIVVRNGGFAIEDTDGYIDIAGTKYCYLTREEAAEALTKEDTANDSH